MSGRGYGDRWWEENSAIPADLEKTTTAAAANAATVSRGSYTVKINLDLVKGKVYKFLFKYQHQDPDTKEVRLSDSSPIWQESFAIPNLTKAVQNLTLTAGSQSYGVKFNIDPTSVQEDVVIFESLTSNFATQTIVYTGTSTNVSILTTGANAFAPRWIKVRSRDRWDDLNISEATAGPVTPFSADVDTTYTVANPGSTSSAPSIDARDLSGFSLVSTISWAQSTDTKTAGYAIRWSTDNPATVSVPLWEYASVSGRSTTSFTATGLIPNNIYYYQVASATPYNVVNWTGSASGTFTASDADGTAAGALARLKSFIAIGGATQDLFKIGTGISQSINLTTVPSASPSLTAGTYHGIVLNKSTLNVGNNFWLTTGQFRVGNPTEFMYWNGTNLYLTGNVNATGGLFTGNVQLAIPAGGVTSGTLFAGDSATTGARVRFSSEGIFAYDSTSTSDVTGKTFSLVQSTGRLDAPVGTVGGWTLATTGFSSGGALILNTGNISLGNNPQANLDSIIRLSADDATYRVWVGSQTGANAPFRVTKEGKLYANGAVIDGTTTIGGSVASTVVSNAANALQASGTLTGNVSGTVNGVAVATVTSGSASGASAIQPGNGVGIDNTSKYINTIDLNSSGIVIKTAASGTRMQLTNAGLELFKSTTRMVWIDAASGDASFAGTVNATGGDFTGYVTGGNVRFGANVNSTNDGIYIDANNYWYDSGNIKVGNADKYLQWNGTTLSVVGTLTAQNNSVIGDWKVDADGTLGSGLGLGGTYLYANGISTGNAVTFSVYTGKMVYAAQGFSAMADSPLVFLNSSPQISSIGGVRINNAFVPSADNTYSLGFTSNRWQIVRSAGGVSTTSDARIKKDISDSELGLNFINALRPVSYKLISGGKVYKDGAEKTVIDNKIVEPEMVDRPGIRTHWGFLAQEVKEAVDACGVEDFAGWQLDDVSDSESGQSLVHHEFLGPIVKAIQELSSRLDALEA
jgi:hypothetical protein